MIKLKLVVREILIYTLILYIYFDWWDLCFEVCSQKNDFYRLDVLFVCIYLRLESIEMELLICD